MSKVKKYLPEIGMLLPAFFVSADFCIYSVFSIHLFLIYQ